MSPSMVRCVSRLFGAVEQKRHSRGIGFVATATFAVVLLGATSSDAVGPYPAVSPCPVFPDPPASLPANAPSQPNETAWNQDISKAPVARSSEATIAYIDAHGGDHIHPDFGSPRAYGFPYAVVGDAQRRVPIHYTAYGSESDRGPFPVPLSAPVEGGAHSAGDRHVRTVDRAGCVLYALYSAFPERGRHPHWNAGSGAEWNLRSAA